MPIIATRATRIIIPRITGPMTEPMISGAGMGGVVAAEVGASPRTARMVLMTISLLKLRAALKSDSGPITTKQLM